MPKEIKITCDNCDKDITYTDRMPAYRVVIDCERLQNVSNSEFAINVIPPIPNTLYFCSLGCMKNYFEKDVND